MVGAKHNLLQKIVAHRASPGGFTGFGNVVIIIDEGWVDGSEESQGTKI